MITPLTISMPNYGKLVKIAKEALGRNIVADSKAKDVEIISKFFGKGIEGSLLRHSFFGFVVFDTYETLATLGIETNLSINIQGTLRPDLDVAIVSGTLQQWRDSIINCQSSYELRVFTKDILNYFDSIGLNNVFSQYRRSQLDDGTLKLEYKR